MASIGGEEAGELLLVVYCSRLTAPFPFSFSPNFAKQLDQQL